MSAKPEEEDTSTFVALHDAWAKYEQRKAELDQQGLSSREYFDACQRIADELGI